MLWNCGCAIRRASRNGAEKNAGENAADRIVPSGRIISGSPEGRPIKQIAGVGRGSEDAPRQDRGTCDISFFDPANSLYEFSWRARV